MRKPTKPTDEQMAEAISAEMVVCPKCRKAIPRETLMKIIKSYRSVWASYCGKLQTPHAGPGRPKKT
jgi:hypothetical protein